MKPIGVGGISGPQDQDQRAEGCETGAKATEAPIDGSKLT